MLRRSSRSRCLAHSERPRLWDAPAAWIPAVRNARLFGAALSVVRHDDGVFEYRSRSVLGSNRGPIGRVFVSAGYNFRGHRIVRYACSGSDSTGLSPLVQSVFHLLVHPARNDGWVGHSAFLGICGWDAAGGICPRQIVDLSLDLFPIHAWEAVLRHEGPRSRSSRLPTGF